MIRLKMYSKGIGRTKSGEIIKANGLVYVNGRQEWTDYHAFLPDPLPPPAAEIYTAEVANSLAQASMAIGELRSAASGMSAFLISGIAKASVQKESQLSSRIEGTIVPTEELLLFEPGISKADPMDWQEVANFNNAQRLAIRDIQAGRDITQHLLKTTHEMLLSGVRGEAWHPGEYRSLQNMIGTKRDVNSARYIPPPVQAMNPMMDDLFAFIAQDDVLDPLTKTALTHYQFEAIHPFEDGNGRLGRLLIILMIIKYGLINEPLIYPSAYFDAHQDEYRDRLLGVSLDGNWAGWISFFLDAIRDACEVAIRRCCRFTELITEAEESLSKPQAPQMLVELLRLFASEFILTKKTAADKLEISYQVARGYFIRLEEAGIIAPYRNKARDTPYYLCGVKEIMGD